MQAGGAAVGVLYLHATHSQGSGGWTWNKVHGQQRVLLRSNQTNEVFGKKCFIKNVSTYSPRGCHGFGHMTAVYVKPWKGLAWHHPEPANQTCMQMFKHI